MEPLSATALSAIANAVLAQVGKELAGTAVQGLKRRVTGDPEQKALGRALERAYDVTRAAHGQVLSRYDVNPSFLQLEGASELAKVLVPGVRASATKLAERCVDSLRPGLDEDERWDRLTALRPVFKTLVDSLAEEVRRERVIDRHRYLRTAGMVRNTMIQLPLGDVFVGLTAKRDVRPGDRRQAWFGHELAKLQSLLESGRLNQTEYEASIDRLRLQLGYEPAAAGGPGDEKPLPVLEAVRTIRHLLVLGEPGSGKTTLLRYLALLHAQALVAVNAARRSPLFPIYLRIGDFARSGYRNDGIGAFLPSYLRGLECRTPGLADLLECRLLAGDCLVLLDGLDEITSADDRRAVVEAVVNFVTANSRQGNRFVVTSRISGYLAAPLPPPFEAVRVQEMDDPTIEQFLSVYCGAVERAEAPEKSDESVQSDARAEVKAMAEALRHSPGIRRLAANPLLLTALVLVHRARGRLPHRRVDAYVEVSEALGRNWRGVHGVPEAELPDDRMLTTWLTHLGGWMHEHRPEGSASMRELLEVLGLLWARSTGAGWDPAVLQLAHPAESDAGRGVRDFVEKADIHTGLLVERAPGRYGFPHLTFEEYYAGRALAFGPALADRAGGIRRRLHDPRYEEPILLALGLVGREQPEEVERLVAEAVYPAEASPHRYEHLLGWDFLFTLRVLADDIPLDVVTVDTLIHRAIDEWMQEHDGRCRFSKYRIALRERLSGLRAPRVAGRLLAAVDAVAERAARISATRFCQLAAAASSVGTLPSRAASVLIALSRSADNPRVRVEAVVALVAGGVVSAEVVAVLVELARGADDPWVRVAAVGALVAGGVVSAELITVLTELARSPDRLGSRREAVRLLREAEATSQLRVFLISLLWDEDDSVGRAAGETLAELVRRHPEVAVEVQASLAEACYDRADEHNIGLARITRTRRSGLCPR
ncbi:MAG TPA: NACHT domain-containing protein [Micromonosporaceae bacterium]|nr:NACHT domain-containing protein [Micromonosporaceae bacterium]